MAEQIEIRPCDSLAEFDRCVELQRLVWGFADIDIVPSALFVVAAACLGTAAAAASIVASDRVREVVTAPSRRHYYEASIFLVIAAISAVLGCVALLSAVRMQPGG